jgi:hypothetical protein
LVPFGVPNPDECGLVACCRDALFTTGFSYPTDDTAMESLWASFDSAATWTKQLEIQEAELLERLCCSPVGDAWMLISDWSGDSQRPEDQRILHYEADTASWREVTALRDSSEFAAGEPSAFFDIAGGSDRVFVAALALSGESFVFSLETDGSTEELPGMPASTTGVYRIKVDTDDVVWAAGQRTLLRFDNEKQAWEQVWP